MGPYTELAPSADPASRMLTMGEYVAGFAPLGHWLASGRIAGCVTTTGAATKLGGSGMSDAKLHNIPAVYLIALNSTLSIGNAPLHDVSEYGMNIVPQLEAELGEGCVVIDNIDRLEDDLRRAQRVLKRNKPVAIAFHPDVLSRETDADVTWTSHPRTFSPQDVSEFLAEFPRVTKGKRVVVYVSGEAAFAPKIRTLTTVLSKVLKAPTVWSVNGANAVARDNEYGYGHISFGGNDRAMELWRSLGKDDVVVALGFDAGEYSLNLARIPAGHVYHFTDLRDAYGHKQRLFRGSLAYAATMELRVFVVNNEVYGIVAKGLEVIIPDFDKKNYHSKLPHIDFVKHAEAHGWDAVRIAPDLSNLKDTMDAAYERKGRSMLIDLPVDADQILGLNPRLNNLTTKTYL